MANKNKGGRNTKKAGKSLKEKRAAKRSKSGSDANSSVDKTFGN